jgi:hypothetical protein
MALLIRAVAGGFFNDEGKSRHVNTREPRNGLVSDALESRLGHLESSLLNKQRDRNQRKLLLQAILEQFGVRKRDMLENLSLAGDCG